MKRACLRVDSLTSRLQLHLPRLLLKDIRSYQACRNIASIGELAGLAFEHVRTAPMTPWLVDMPLW